MGNNGGMDIIIVSGMSGSGKNTVNKIIEDFGYFCIDNMPAELITELLNVYAKNPDQNKRISLTLDIRDKKNVNRITQVINTLKSSPELTCRVIFLDASDDIIISRYKETRRIHPLVLSGSLSLKDALTIEREYMAPIRNAADYVLDTSFLKISQAREIVAKMIGVKYSAELVISCMSFGYKYGLPQEADLVIDARCLPNPYYVPELKEHNGLEACVYDYVTSFDQTKQFIAKTTEFLSYLIPMYIEEGKAHLTIAVGCTGGKHRSVSMVRAICENLSDAGYVTNAVHRDLNRE